MKRFLFLLLAVLLFCSGCNLTSLAAFGLPTSVSEETPSDTGRQITGKVKRIDGNQLILELGSTESDAATSSLSDQPGTASAAAGHSGQNPDTPSPAGGENTAPLVDGNSAAPSADHEDTALPAMGGGASGDGSGRRNQQAASVSFHGSGQTETLFIPVNTPVYAAGNTETALRFSLLSVGQIINLTLSSSADQAEYISLIQVVET